MTNASRIAEGFVRKKLGNPVDGGPLIYSITVPELTELVAAVQHDAVDHPRKPAPAATAQRDAARRNRYEVIYERTLMLALLTAQFEAHIAPTRRKPAPTDTWRWVVCVHTPEGKLTWKIDEEDRADVFAALAERPDDSDPAQTKESKVAALEALVKQCQPLPEGGAKARPVAGRAKARKRGA